MLLWAWRSVLDNLFLFFQVLLLDSVPDGDHKQLARNYELCKLAFLLKVLNTLIPMSLIIKMIIWRRSGLGKNFTINTEQHLFQRIAEHKYSAIGKHLTEAYCGSNLFHESCFKVTKKCQSNFDY